MTSHVEDITGVVIPADAIRLFPNSRSNWVHSRFADAELTFDQEMLDV